MTRRMQQILNREYFREFDGRGVIIAGGAAGIGAALAEAFLWLGAKVAVLDKDPAPHGFYIPADLKKEEERRRAIADAC